MPRATASKCASSTASAATGRGIEVEFNVKVPADATIDLRTVSGDIRVTNVKGEVRVQSISGNLCARRYARLAAVKTVSGGITITNAGADAPLSLSTVNGDLLMQTLNTRALDVNTRERRRAHQRLVRRSRDDPNARRRSRSADEPRQGRALRNRIAFRRASTCRCPSSPDSSSKPTRSTAAFASTSRSRARDRSATAIAVRARCAAPMATAARACACRRSMGT